MKETIFRKSLPAYIWPVIWVILKLALVIYVFNRLAFLEAWLAGWNTVPTEYVPWLARGLLVMLGLSLLRSIGWVVWQTTYRVGVSEAGVSLSYGVMPWNKFERFWEPNQIFNCLYNSSGFFNWAVRQGNLILQGSEGATHQFVFQNIGRVRTACELVNQIRARGGPNPQSGSA